MLLMHGLYNCCNVNAIDGSALLLGVRASRIALTHGKMEIHLKKKSSFSPVPSESRLLIFWKGDSIKFIENREEDGKIGPQLRISIRTENEIRYTYPGYGGILDTADHGHRFLLFDPRLLGVLPVLSPSMYAKNVLFPEGIQDGKLLDNNVELDGNKCVHLFFRGLGGVAFEYWIADEPNFPVLKIRDYNNDTITESSYESKLVFPDQIKVTQLSSNGDQVSVTEMKISDVSTDYMPSDSDFTLENLELPIGARVQDERVSSVVGFWNGKGLSETQRDAFEDAELRSRADRGVAISPGVWFVLFLLLIVLLYRLVWFPFFAPSFRS